MAKTLPPRRQRSRSFGSNTYVKRSGLVGGAPSTPQTLGDVLKVTTEHTTGTTIVADLTGSEYDGFASILNEANLIGAFFTASGTDTGVLPAMVVETATREFTGVLTNEPPSGPLNRVYLNLSFANAKTAS